MPAGFFVVDSMGDSATPASRETTGSTQDSSPRKRAWLTPRLVAQHELKQEKKQQGSTRAAQKKRQRQKRRDKARQQREDRERQQQAQGFKDMQGIWNQIATSQAHCTMPSFTPEEIAQGVRLGRQLFERVGEPPWHQGSLMGMFTWMTPVERELLRQSLLEVEGDSWQRYVASRPIVLQPIMEEAAERVESQRGTEQDDSGSPA